MTPRPQFKTYDEWFAWILRKLRHGSWSSKSTKFYAWGFLVGYSRYIGKAKEPLAASRDP